MKKLQIKRKIRKIIKWTLLCMLIISVIIISRFRTAFPGLNEHANLIVNGNEISDKMVWIYEQVDHSFCGVLPFMTILNELGYPVEWIHEEAVAARVFIRGEEYILWIDECKIDTRFHGVKFGIADTSLHKLNEIENYIISEASDDNYLSIITKKDIYLESPTLAATMDNLGINVEIMIDPEKRMIIINTRN